MDAFLFAAYVFLVVVVVLAAYSFFGRLDRDLAVEARNLRRTAAALVVAVSLLGVTLIFEKSAYYDLAYRVSLIEKADH
ncbi:MAG: hypothetical protein ACXWUF_20355 [Methylomagnum sp.]